MDRNIKEIISQMTLEEKASLCSGLDLWHTKPVERLGIPSIMMTDGPHGMRKQENNPGQIGLDSSVPAICFPSGAGLACSFDRDLMEKVGRALGEECQAEGVSIILGPAANIKRSPLCGRNFEYFSEDPYLSSEMAAHHIKGVQSQGVGTSLKHFAANNQEHRRMTVDEIIGERALQEIYLASFEGAVKQSKPWTVMCSYNKINGVYSSENKYTLTDILRNEWGFDGFVMSDWGAVDERVPGLESGLELEMPSSGGVGDKKIVGAVKSGRLSEEVLDRAVERILKVVFKAADNKKKNATYDREAHHKLAGEVERECIVLLKNENNILPLKREGTLAVIGAFAKSARYQGGGSSHINPSKLEVIYDEIQKTAGGTNVLYSKGYDPDADDVDKRLIDEAKEAASMADTAVVFAGLPERYESEGYDREHMRMPENQVKLIEAVSEVQKNVVVVLSNGSPVEMPWIDRVQGVIEMYLGGQALGGAIAGILFGDANPCGKLAETFPVKLSDNPSYINFPGEGDRVEYGEGLFAGYRYYDAKEIEPLFPFGYGLSYTSFEYSGLSIDKKEITDKEKVNVSLKVKNTGDRAGKEIVQLYVRDTESTVPRPVKELKGFEKVELKPGEEKTVCFTLGLRAFAYYNTGIKDWHIESGDFEILIGKSSRDIVLKENIKINSSVSIKKIFHRNSTLGDVMENPEKAKIAADLLQNVFKVNSDDKEVPGVNLSMFKDMPLRALVNFSAGAFDDEQLEKLLEKLNRR